jgi:polysaccharide export outer membrane protein
MRKVLFALAILSIFSSCRVLRPSLMLKTPKGFVFDKVADTMATEEYRIAPTDAISFRILSNEGFKLVDINTQGVAAQAIASIETTVESDGTVKIPLIGRVKIQGLTVREAEQLLETRFSEFYVGPYILMKVTNKRVIIYPGNAGLARVLFINNINTTVFEALALAGGVTEDGKAYKVKLVRKASPKPKVYLMDLSTIDGLKEGSTIVQANDIIYVEPRIRYGQRISTEIIPYVSLLSTFILIYSIFRTK